MTLHHCEVCGKRVRATKRMRDRYDSLKNPVIVCQACRYKKMVPRELMCTRFRKNGRLCNGVRFDRNIEICALCRRKGYE